MRTDIHIVKLKSHSTGKTRGCLGCNEEVNNTEHVTYHCPLARFVWDIVRDLMRIMICTERRIDEKAAMINYNILEKNINDKKNRKYCNTLMVIDRRKIHTL